MPESFVTRELGNGAVSFDCVGRDACIDGLAIVGYHDIDAVWYWEADCTSLYGTRQESSGRGTCPTRPEAVELAVFFLLDARDAVEALVTY